MEYQRQADAWFPLLFHDRHRNEGSRPLCPFWKVTIAGVEWSPGQCAGQGAALMVDERQGNLVGGFRTVRSIRVRI